MKQLEDSRNLYACLRRQIEGGHLDMGDVHRLVVTLRGESEHVIGAQDDLTVDERLNLLGSELMYAAERKGFDRRDMFHLRWLKAFCIHRPQAVEEALASLARSAFTVIDNSDRAVA